MAGRGLLWEPETREQGSPQEGPLSFCGYGPWGPSFAGRWSSFEHISFAIPEVLRFGHEAPYPSRQDLR